MFVLEFNWSKVMQRKTGNSAPVNSSNAKGPTPIFDPKNGNLLDQVQASVQNLMRGMRLNNGTTPNNNGVFSMPNISLDAIEKNVRNIFNSTQGNKGNNNTTPNNNGVFSMPNISLDAIEKWAGKRQAQEKG